MNIITKMSKTSKKKTYKKKYNPQERPAPTTLALAPYNYKDIIVTPQTLINIIII